MFVILPFGLTLLPLAFKIYKTEGDKEYYKKLKTYVAFFLAWAGFALSLFSEEIVILFAQEPSYYPAYKVVPLIVFAYVIYGVSMISSLGMYLTGKNHFIALITIICAGLNIALNFWLIPRYGMMGAAVNTVISFAILDGLSNIASGRYYKIPYEHFKIIRLFLFAVLFFVFIGLFNELEFESQLLLKIISIISFPLFVILLKYFTRDELISMNGALKKWIKPSTWKDVFKNSG